jgi:ADP-heptose:LPS heptosyltransferase
MVKFLVVRFSSIGDIVLTSPVIRCLKKQVENAEVYYLTKSCYADIVSSNSYIDKVFFLERDFNNLIKKLKAEEIDYIIDLHRNIRTLRLKIALRKLSFSVNKINFRKWMLVNFRMNKLPATHIVDRYLETTKAFSVKNDGEGLDYFIPDTDRIDSPYNSENGLIDYMVLVAGGGHYTKQIPVNQIVKIIDQIEMPVVLLGGTDDIQKATVIEEKVTYKKVINLVGKLTINQSASVIDQAKLVITPDTGLMHIASALKKDIFSVWGNTIPAFGMAPYKPGKHSEIIEVQGLKCRPCSKIGFSSCPKRHFRCMEEQDFGMVVRKVKKLITK